MPNPLADPHKISNRYTEEVRREGAVMKAVRWEDTKREIRELEPGWDAPDRVAERERSRAEMRAE